MLLILYLILDYNTLDDNYSLVNKKYERGLFLEVSLAQSEKDKKQTPQRVFPEQRRVNGDV